MRNKLVVLFLLMVILAACRKDPAIEPSFYACGFTFNDSSASNPGNASYQGLLDQMKGQGVPGVMMSVYKPASGMWLGAAGMADIGNSVALKSCNISRVGSTVKTFTAVTILLLQEQGLLNIDDKISDYLSGTAIDKIENAKTATIRQCMQHSSGIFNYIQNLKFQTASLNDLVKVWTPDELLSYAYNKDAYFAPGEGVRYSNTNYVFLGQIIEKVTGKPFYQVFQELIFTPMNMTMTRFAALDNVPDGIIRGYVDMYSNLDLIESTYYSGWDYYTADGGLISNPYDMSRFLYGLFSGQILDAYSLNEMLTFRAPSDPDPEFFKIEYGLGIFKMYTSYGIAYFHSGDAIGYYANMMYFPSNGTTIVYETNGNYGQIDQYTSSETAIDNILAVVMN
jgi:D-alanyl-D-alanine carboxypeptidase